jgi:hypothetical protein
LGNTKLVSLLSSSGFGLVVLTRYGRVRYPACSESSGQRISPNRGVPHAASLRPDPLVLIASPRSAGSLCGPDIHLLLTLQNSPLFGWAAAPNGRPTLKLAPLDQATTKSRPTQQKAPSRGGGTISGKGRLGDSRRDGAQLAPGPLSLSRWRGR